MYIRSNSNAEKVFVRFGKRFKHGKSINYLAMNPRIKDEYSYKLAELQYGHIDEAEFDEWCEGALEDFVWEPNTSCFNCNTSDGNLPVVTNVSQVKTLIGFIKRFEDDLPCEAFLVTGVQVGTGTDNEPLVNVTQETPVEYDLDDLIDVALDALCAGFRYSTEASNSIDNFEYIGNGMYQYKDMMFAQPKSSFIANYEYTGQVMDKFKYEQPVDVDRTAIGGIYVGADANGGASDIADCVYEWGNDIYSKPFYFENAYHLAIQILPNKDIEICGAIEDIENFIDEFPIDYEDLNETEVTSKLKQKYMGMTFYE